MEQGPLTKKMQCLGLQETQTYLEIIDKPETENQDKNLRVWEEERMVKVTEELKKIMKTPPHDQRYGQKTNSDQMRFATHATLPESANVAMEEGSAVLRR